jgi:hypothetical protein
MTIQPNCDEDNLVIFRIKKVFTCITKDYEISRHLTITDMINLLSENIPQDFQLRTGTFEFVELGQDHLINLKAEERNPIIPSSLQTIRERYNSKFVTFYVRSKELSILETNGDDFN